MKTIKLFTLAVMAVGAISCAKDIVPETQIPNTESNLVSVTFNAKGESSEETKVLFSGYPKIAWQASDAISLVGVKTGNQMFTTETSGHEVAFSGQADLSDEYFYGVYPYDADVTLNQDGTLANVTVPAVQTATAGNFDPSAYIAIAKSTDKESLEFKAIGGFIKFNFQNFDTAVRSVTLVSNGGKVMAGTANSTSLNADGSTSHSGISSATASTSVKLQGTFDLSKAYFMIVRPAPYDEGVTVYVELEDGRVLSRSGSNSLFESGKSRNYIRAMILDGNYFKEATDLYTLYEMGYNVEVAGKVINKATEGDATLITSTSENKAIDNIGVYFINSDVEGANMPAKIYDKDTYIIGNGESKANITLSGTVQWKANTIAFKNVNFIDGHSNDLMKPNAANGSILFDSCDLVTDTEKSQLIYANTTIVNMAFHNCDIKVDANTKDLIKMGTTGIITNLILYNNIFYSTIENGAASFKVINNGSKVENLTLNQNTFANVYPATTYMTPSSVTSYTVTHNLFYLDKYNAVYSNPYTNILSCKPDECISDDNYLYKDVNNARLRIYINGDYTSFTATKSTVVTGEVDLTVPTIVPATTAGATR